MHRRLYKHKYPHRFKFFKWLAAALIVYGLWWTYQEYVNPSFDINKIYENSELKEKTFTKMPVEVTTPQGLKLWLIEDKQIPIVSMAFLFKKAGRGYDAQNQEGLAALVAEVLPQGAGKYNSYDYHETLELNGIHLSFSVGLENFTGQISFPSANMAAAEDILAETFKEPLFPDNALNSTKQQFLTALAGQKETPEGELGLEFAKVLYGNHPYARNPLGDAQDIQNLSREDLQNYVKTMLVKENLIIGIAGDISSEQASALVDNVFASLAADSIVEELKAPKMNLQASRHKIDRKTAQVISSFAAFGVAREDKDFYPLYVANYIFGGSGLTSRLSLEAREKNGLTYGIGTYLATDEKTPLILGQFSSTPENYEQMYQILLNQWQNFAKNGVSKEELAAAKNYLLASYNLRFNSTEGLADMLVAMQEYNLGLDFLQKRNGYIKDITLKQVNEAARHYFGSLPMEVSIGSVKEQNGEN